MPMLSIVASKKVTAIVTLEDSTAKQIDQYAAFTKGSADDVVNAALEYIFSKDKDFQKFREENTNARATLPLRIKRPASNGAKPGQQQNGTGTSTAAAR